MSATALDLWGVTISKETADQIIEKAKQWALLHGVQMKPQHDHHSTCHCEYAPITLFPSPLPVPVLQEAKSLQKHYNLLMHRVANDPEFLCQCLKNVIKVDEFTKMLYDIYKETGGEKSTQKVSLGLFRNDYMMDVKDSCCTIKILPASLNLKQIEFNTIASSFAGLSSAMWNVHRYTMKQAGIKCSCDQLPENKPAHGLAVGFVKAWECYGNPDAVILFIVQSVERNSVDQRWLERFVHEINHNIHVVYSTLLNASEHCKLTKWNTLMLDGKEVAVIYYRDGYMPNHYPTNKEKDVRLLMEKSCAIKCPNVGLQLAGCKKVQQELAVPGVLEKFIKDIDVCDCIRKTFAGQYSLDRNEEGDRNVEMALAQPKKFVLKPQREGGGNNVYGEDIREFLSGIRDSEERNAYILMERIFPWPQKNYLLKEGKEPILRDVISELGIYGVYLGTAEEEFYNAEAGHVLRTKSTEDDEGGIVAGFATMDSPLLVYPPKLSS
ncbi:glutathione synthetase-like [Ruditapes philippinarum]|uniref:glutathione synthetase-like n=1 Tax=Ruditapes philippinarum TaxID=129788 RepID=UPI00295BCFFD|nr:glutathione synthetase-like [Ruditapes philippinarum]XP_060564459.1 glutathione synthetase-like [Ruditapes philippinarum]XP_060564460.1 glutathione synthetase-like [Ruditapes philippinarum]